VFLDTDEHLDDFRRRATIVHIQSEELPVAEAPYGEPVSGMDIELDEVVTEMPAGRELIFAGKDADTGQEITEVAVVKSWDNNGANTVIRLEQALDRRYRRADLVIHGNVVAATHGSSVTETLGSGSGASAHQRFTLKAAPLTWVAASTATGAQSTLEVRVDGVRWEPVESLHEEGPTDQVYVMRRDENGYTQIEMGDGVHGARLPSGTNNVTARYRKGLGLDGEVDAGRLTLLQSRPQGLRGVSNPAAASGAANPETADETRENAPLGILTLDRLVSLQDYEDFARAFAGVGKAGASELWDGKRGFVHVTIASASGEELDEDAATVTALVEAFASYKDPAHVVVVSPHDQVLFGVQLKVVRDLAHLEADVEAAVRAALEQAFSFSMRRFGQSVTAAEVITVAQGAAGVVAVDLDALHREGESAVYNATLTAARAAWSGGGITRAQLLLLGPELVTVGWMEA
jgi:predicted phage baseplate assembly protein